MATNSLELSKPLTSVELRALLRRKYPGNQYAMLYEVRDAAGFGASRSADVIMVGLWPSRGCEIEGIEIKISRTDWLRELKRPEKAEAFVPYCDRWWVCAGNDNVVDTKELPPTWGLIVPRGRGLSIVKEAPRLKPKPVDRSLLAAMMKRATDTANSAPEVVVAIEDAVRRTKESLEQTQKIHREHNDEKLERLERAIEKFQEASGVEISTWNAGNIGAAVNLVLTGKHHHEMRSLAHMKGQVRRLAAWFDRELPDVVED